MKRCIICDRSTRRREDDFGDVREYALCSICSNKRIVDAYDYIANRKEEVLIEQLIKMENLLL